MRKRTTMALAAGVLVAALVPAVATAAGGPDHWVIDTELCNPVPVTDPSDIGGMLQYYRSISEFCGDVQVRPVFAE